MKKADCIYRIREDLYRLRFALPVILTYAIVTQLFFHTICPFAIFTGFACPACGMTRAAILMITGHPAASLAFHPLTLLWPAFLLYLGFFRYIRGRSAPFSRFLGIALCLVTLGYYCYRLARGTLPEVPAPGILHLASNALT